MSDGPGGGLASKAHLAVWGRGRGKTPSTWVVTESPGHTEFRGLASVTPSTEKGLNGSESGFLVARLQLRRLREAGFQRGKLQCRARTHAC
jgi:hypothetical protein